MGELELKTFVCGDLLNNCYVIFDKKSKKSFIVDAPAPSDELRAFIKEQKLEIILIALTHAHFDHIEGLDTHPFGHKYDTPFYIHRDDASFLKDSQLNGSAFFTSIVSIKKKPDFYQENEPLLFDKYSIEIINTPGHSPGSVSLKLGKWLFSGDALFAGSVGRTDIPLASHQVLINAIKNKLLTLPSDTIVYPGHGSATTIGKEKNENPFLK